jgi:hypothetical protein
MVEAQRVSCDLADTAASVIHSSLQNETIFPRYKLNYFYDTEKTKQTEYKPSVYFSVGHDDNFIAICFFVEEDTVKATYAKSQHDPVWTDSCVEFFVTKDNKEKVLATF